MRYNIIKKILCINIQLEKRRVGGLLRLTLCNVQIMCTINFNNNKCTVILSLCVRNCFFIAHLFVYVTDVSRMALALGMTFAYFTVHRKNMCAYLSANNVRSTSTDCTQSIKIILGGYSLRNRNPLE